MDKTLTTRAYDNIIDERCTCALCGNAGIIDTTGVRTPSGLAVGRKNWCICQNGQVLSRWCTDRDRRAKLTTPLMGILAAILFLVVSVPPLLAQKVNPTSLTFVAVPGYSSSPQMVAFTNTGDTQIPPLTISITGPFSIPQNTCGKGVKPSTHCNVYVVYNPTGIETDTGTLGITFNGQTIQIPLTGDGVSSIPTSFKHAAYDKKTGNINIQMYAAKNVIPDGELVYVTCIDYEGANFITDYAPLQDNRATVIFTGRDDDWQCGVIYYGDAEFMASGYGDFWINQCVPVDSCHDNGAPSLNRKME